LLIFYINQKYFYVKYACGQDNVYKNYFWNVLTILEHSSYSRALKPEVGRRFCWSITFTSKQTL